MPGIIQQNIAPLGEKGPLPRALFHARQPVPCCAVLDFTATDRRTRHGLRTSYLGTTRREDALFHLRKLDTGSSWVPWMSSENAGWTTVACHRQPLASLFCSCSSFLPSPPPVVGSAVQHFSALKLRRGLLVSTERRGWRCVGGIPVPWTARLGLWILPVGGALPVAVIFFVDEAGTDSGE